MTTTAHEQLTALDATFLELEERDASAHMHVGGALVFGPRPHQTPPPTLDELAATLAERLHAMPRFAQRLSEPRTGGLTWPHWEAVPDHDPRDHLHRAALPAPGGQEQLEAFLADFWSHRLDRDRPLWEMVVLEGLEDGRWALVSKLHHCMVDGVSAVDVSHLLLDGGPEEAPVQPDAPAGSTLSRLLHLPFALAQPALHPRRTANDLKAMAEVLVRDELNAAPQTSLNGPTGPRRRYATLAFNVAELKQLRNRLGGGTLNDVVLSLCAGGFHRLFAGRGEVPPAKGLRCMVPVNIRADGEHGTLGNKISSLFVNLPVAAGNALDRYARTRQETDRLKAGGEAHGSSTLINAIALLPPALHAGMAASLFATRLFNVTVTNIPGPKRPLSAFGAPLEEIWPLVPLAADHAIGIAVITYGETLFVGIAAAHDSVPDLERLANGISAEREELRELAG